MHKFIPPETICLYFFNFPKTLHKKTKTKNLQNHGENHRENLQKSTIQYKNLSLGF